MDFASRSPMYSAARILAVWMFFATAASPAFLRAEDTTFASVAMSYINRAMNAFSVRFTGDEEKAAQTTGNPEEIAKQSALEGFLQTMFLQEKGCYFTQSRWGAKPVPYQVRGIQTVALENGSLNGSDRTEGIDERITFEIKVKTHRLYDEKGGWGDWVKGNPPHLDSVTLVRQSGEWKVSVSPAWAYSLR